MASLRVRHLLILLLVALVRGDRMRKTEPTESTVINSSRDATNQTSADTLNLPANASSIRENITDTFSCENRTYGYYADVDNDCQVFHVCLPSQTPSGRNVTYRWSFICPKETVFNQAVLTCTREADSIDCQDSPEFYHLNMEMGKEPNKTEEAKDKKDNRKIQKRKQEKRKENIIMTNEVNDIMNEEFKGKLEPLGLISRGENEPVLIESVIESVDPDDIEDVEQEEKNEEEMDRIVMERNMRNERQMRRGLFRFKGDV
ncbi:hypothetical protein PYW07_011625 [Mythimna separata]|uniref:Chitin-binding type-2 domain-containing protein n=1 Tax=Mythimna separata TaxID=271217 RepID=A0AAD8DJQ7_MYTSE|nr:hypothetical protein PYW07_011625 [Mythimna separata]